MSRLADALPCGSRLSGALRVALLNRDPQGSAL